MTDSTPIAGESVAPKFEPFTITDVAYKHVNGTPILASILIPKDLKPGKHPVTVRWHGGGMGTGTRLYADWYADWALSLTTKHAAIAISPDYRLLPEARGVDILADIADFFAWLQRPGALAAHLPAGIVPDLDDRSVLVMGESAGGWLALQSGFLAPRRSDGSSSSLIAAVIAQYPMIDLRAPHYTQAYVKEIFSPPVPQLDEQILRAHVAGLKGGEVVTGRMPPEGLPMTVVLMQRGLYAEFFGTEEALYPLERLEHTSEYPPLWIIHGDVDNAVPVEGTEKFAKKFTEKIQGGQLRVSIVKGENHGFDVHDASSGAPATLETEWVKPGVEFVETHWPLA